MMSPLLEINEKGREKKNNNNHKINKCTFQMKKLKRKINTFRNKFFLVCFGLVKGICQALSLQSFVHKISDHFFIF